MKTLPGFFALCAVTALAAVRLSAQLESLQIEPTVKPPLSPVMLMEGVTEGRVIFAIDVNEKGQLTDWLTLGYTHPALVRPCIEAMKEWKMTPARFNGQPIAVQVQLTINYTAEGVVISRSGVFDLEHHVERIFGYRLVGRARSAGELDSVPARIVTVTPQYAADAEKQGVHGTVQVRFYIDETGSVRMPSVVAGAHPYLSDAAVTAVKGWHFQPPTSRGTPVLVAAQQEFAFGK